MKQRLLATLLAASMLAGAIPAWAANPMGYQLISDREAARLPRGHGALGLVVNESSMISDSGMNFAILRVDQIKPGSTGATSGLQVGDQIIAVDGHVFPDLRAFAEYAGSLRPRSQALIDYIPRGMGPKDAQRLALTVGEPGRNNQPTLNQGMSTGTKVAIGVGAAALLGCYEMGCFSPPQRQRGDPATADAAATIDAPATDAAAAGARLHPAAVAGRLRRRAASARPRGRPRRRPPPAPPCPAPWSSQAFRGRC